MQILESEFYVTTVLHKIKKITVLYIEIYEVRGFSG